MCLITRMLCQVCEAIDEHLFHPCEEFVNSEVLKMKEGLVQSRRYHCPALAWTPPKDALSYHICDACLYDGICHFLRTAALRMDEEETDRAALLARKAYVDRCYGPLVRPRPVGRLAPQDDEADAQKGLMMVPIQESKADQPYLRELKGYLPQSWPDLTDSFKRFIVDVCIQQTKLLPEVRTATGSHVAYAIRRSLEEGEFADYWKYRVSAKKSRTITLCIPCCTLCKYPSFDEEGAIQDIEMEPDLTAIHALADLRLCEKVFAVKIKTAFLHKPCKTCIDKETKLRGEVHKFLHRDCHIEAWSIWNWLILRSTGMVDFWNHQVMSVVIPNVEPAGKSKFMELMATGWKARSGVEWENTVDLGPLQPFWARLEYHDEPLLHLSQWNKLARVWGVPDPRPKNSPVSPSGSESSEPLLGIKVVLKMWPKTEPETQPDNSEDQMDLTEDHDEDQTSKEAEGSSNRRRTSARQSRKQAHHTELPPVSGSSTNGPVLRNVGELFLGHEDHEPTGTDRASRTASLMNAQSPTTTGSNSTRQSAKRKGKEPAVSANTKTKRVHFEDLPEGRTTDAGEHANTQSNGDTSSADQGPLAGFIDDSVQLCGAGFWHVHSDRIGLNDT